MPVGDRNFTHLKSINTAYLRQLKVLNMLAEVWYLWGARYFLWKHKELETQGILSKTQGVRGID